MQTNDGTVYHYRDRNDLECDAFVYPSNGRLGRSRRRLGRVDEAAVNLLRLKGLVDSEAENTPSFLMVVIVTSYTYTRVDGVHVIPIVYLRE